MSYEVWFLNQNIFIDRKEKIAQAVYYEGFKNVSPTKVIRKAWHRNHVIVVFLQISSQKM